MTLNFSFKTVIIKVFRKEMMYHNKRVSCIHSLKLNIFWEILKNKINYLRYKTQGVNDSLAELTMGYWDT